MHRLISIAAAVGLVAAIPSLLLADEIDDAAADGADFATQAFPDATVDQDGNVSIGGGTDQQENLTPADLFPDANATDADVFTSIDTEEKAAAAGEQARGQESDAIDVIDDTNAQERDDLSDDPFLDTTDQVFGDIDGVADEFGACSTQREAIPVTNTALIPEERFCERIRKVEGDCTITH